VTCSANDAAVVVSEAIAGSEAEFAKLMTKKARALGMTNTTYINASGLPADEQRQPATKPSLVSQFKSAFLATIIIFPCRFSAITGEKCSTTMLCLVR
jgi:D-alanyl-D-alanine carboxypeptidase